ncbi:MAG: hypothetical protein ACW99A_21390, partial [Candidatus Kariarchaeaceae archaeon]
MNKEIPTKIRNAIISLKDDNYFTVISLMMKNEHNKKQTTYESIIDFGFTWDQTHEVIEGLRNGGLVKEENVVVIPPYSHYTFTDFGNLIIDKLLEA